MTNFYFRQSENTIEVHAQTDAAVNAWSGAVEITDTNAIASILTRDSDGIIWKTIPTVEAGKGISFAGGVPSGFVGDRVLFRFTLRIPVSSLSFSPDSSLYLSDGNGTEILAPHVSFFPVAYPLNAAVPTIRDTTPPEPFTPELYRDATTFGATPVVMFVAHDNDSGIQKYEIREATARGFGDWRIAESPYAINADVTGLEIRAYDNAGNVRTESISLSTVSNIYMYTVPVVAIITLILVYTIYKWRKNS